ncbi:MAG: DUF6429 family protein [Actinomycetota bacterium]
MTYDENEVANVVLALLYLNSFKEHEITRAWKGFDWDAMNLLHERGLIADPKSKAKSVALTEEGVRMAKELFDKHFGLQNLTDNESTHDTHRPPSTALQQTTRFAPGC